MKKPLLNEFDRFCMRHNTLAGAFLELKLARLRFLRDIKNEWVIVQFNKLINISEHTN